MERIEYQVDLKKNPSEEYKEILKAKIINFGVLFKTI